MGREGAELVKCLPHMHEDMSLIPQNPHLEEKKKLWGST